MNRDLENLSVELIDRDERNPRLVFPEDELERLAESIAAEGVLVPILVYRRDDDRFTLVDGERRWICSKRLGLPEIPAIIIPEPDEPSRLLQMFNIHMVREPWQDMPTAWALQLLIDETGIDNNRDLADRTGLSIERIKRLRHALELPSDYQTYIHEGTIPLNFFWELKRNVIDPLAQQRPNLFEEYGEEHVLQAFVDKRLGGVVTDVVSLRDVRPIINMAGKDADDSGSSPLDQTIRTLIEDPVATIQDAYEDTVMVMVEADKLQRRSDAMIKAFERLLAKASPEEREFLQKLGADFAERLMQLLE